MGKPRKILHLDLDAFFCAVEEQFDPSLHGKAFAVGGLSDRGVISTCSYAARKFGVHSAMPTVQAVRLCPHLIMVHSGFHRYDEKSKEVMAILHEYTPLVEQVSVDEAYLDVSDLPDPIEKIARTIQKTIHAQTHLPCSLGGGTNKLIAKIANGVGKKSVRTSTYPNAILCVHPGLEKEFLRPLKIGELLGVGKKTEQTLKNMGVFTIGQLADLPAEVLLRRLGKFGSDLHSSANGIYQNPVHAEDESAKSVSQEITFETDVDDEDILRQMILHQSDAVGKRLRKEGLAGTTVRIKLRWSNFVTITRQTKTDAPVSQNSKINDYAQKLFSEAWLSGRDPVRLIGVGVSGFDEKMQLPLFQPDTQREDHLLQAWDKIHERFGSKALRRCSDLQKEK